MASTYRQAVHPSWLPNPLTKRYLDDVGGVLGLRERTREENRRRRFQHDRSTTPPPPDSPAAAYATTVGTAVGNGHLNRYADVIAYDRTRVVFSEESGNADRYINANWVRERLGGKWTIATQAPIDRTVHTFLSMFMSAIVPPNTYTTTPTPQRPRTIVQLTPNVEGRTTKAFQYFPKEVGSEITWPSPPGSTSPGPSIVVSLLESNQQDAWISSTLRLSYDTTPQDFRLVRHLHYQGWPDHGVPADVRSLLRFMKYVQVCNQDTTHQDASRYPDPPIVIGCSAGVGRTGTFIAIASLLRAHGLNQPSSLASPFQTPPPLPDSALGALPAKYEKDLAALEIDALRDQRPMMIQSVEQLHFVYTAFLAALQLEANEK